MARAHIALAVATALLVGPTLGCGVMLYDVGELFFFADALRTGRTPGLDFVVNGYGPGRYLLFAALFQDGPSLAVAAAVFGVLRLGISALAWEVARRVVDRGAWLVPAALLVAPGPLHKGFFLLGTLALALALLRWLEDPCRRRAWALGAVVAGAGLFRLDLGLFGLALGALVLVGQRPRDLGALVAPSLAAGAAVLGWTLADGATAAVVAQVLDDVAKNQTITDPRFPGVARVASLDVEAWLLVLPLLVYPLLALGLRRVDPPNRRRMLVVLLLGVLTANQVRMKPELGHLLQAGPMLWLALAALLQRLPRVPQHGAQLAVLGLLASAAFVRPGDVYTGAFTIPWERVHVVPTAAGPARLNPGERAELEPLLAALAATPPGPLWVPSNEPLLFALSGRPSASPVVGVVYVVGDAAAQAAVIEHVEAAAPPVAVFVDSTIEGPSRTLREGAPALHEHLTRRYAPTQTFGRFTLMERR